MPDNRWRIKSDADEEHPRTELTPMLAGHGMEAEPVYILPSNPVTQACIEGRCVQVWHVKQDNARAPVEEALTDFLRNQAVQFDPVQSGIRHPPDRVQLSRGVREFREEVPWEMATGQRPRGMFSWVDTSIGTTRKVLGVIGENIYGLINPQKPR